MPSSLQCDALLNDDTVDGDKDKRTVTVHLVTSPVQFCCEMPGSDGSLHHWALVFAFKGHRVVRLEIQKGNGGCIEPHVNWDWPRRGEGGFSLTLGDYVASPNEVIESAKINELNGKAYKVNKRNCQHWVKKMAEKLPDHIREKLDDVKTFSEAKPICAAVVNSSMSFKKTKD